MNDIGFFLLNRNTWFFSIFLITGSVVKAQDSLDVWCITYEYVYKADDSLRKPSPMQQQAMDGGNIRVYYTTDEHDPKYKLFRGDSLREIGEWKTDTHYHIYKGLARKAVGVLALPDPVTVDGETHYLFPLDFEYAYKSATQEVLGRPCSVIVAWPSEGNSNEEFWVSLNWEIPNMPWYYFGFLSQGFQGGLMQAMVLNRKEVTRFGIRATDVAQHRVPDDFFSLPPRIKVDELLPPQAFP